MSSISEHRLQTLAGIIVEDPMPNIDRQPGWADFAGTDATIRRNDFSDPNFVRKSIFDLIGEDRKLPMILWAFDGNDKLEHLSLWGNSKVWPQMAKAMMGLYPRAKAIFLSAKNKNMVLVAMDGQVRDKPVSISHQSPNGNPANDWDFIHSLPRHLAQIAQEEGAGREAKVAKEGSPKYRAWINVSVKKLMPIGSQDFRDVLRSKSTVFGAAKASNDLQARDMAERNGWVAGEITTNKEGRVIAIVYAKDEASALKGARLLFADRYKQHPWISLTVRTNYATNTYTGGDKIYAYLKGENGKPTHYVDS